MTLLTAPNNKSVMQKFALSCRGIYSTPPMEIAHELQLH